MKIVEVMLSTGAGGVVTHVAEQFGLDPGQAAAALSMMLPALAGGIEEKLAVGDSIISNFIRSGNLQRFADEPSTLSSQAALDQGQSLLDAIFGREDTSNLISMVAEKSGLGGPVISQMLPIAATLLGAFLAKRVAEGGSLTDAVTRLSDPGHAGITGAVKSLASRFFG